VAAQVVAEMAASTLSLELRKFIAGRKIPAAGVKLSLLPECLKIADPVWGGFFCLLPVHHLLNSRVLL